MLIETPEKSSMFVLSQADVQTGFFFKESEVSAVFHNQFRCVGRFGNGTGFVVEKNDGSQFFVTAKHCIEIGKGAKKTTAHLDSGDWLEIDKTLLRTPPQLPNGEERDLFMYDLHSPQLKPTLRGLGVSSNSTINPGDLCYTIGYPESFLRNRELSGPVLSAGRIRSIDEDRNLINTTVRLEPGNSGGPLLNMWGQVIGVMVGRWVYRNGEVLHDDARASRVYDPSEFNWAEIFNSGTIDRR